MAHSGANGSLMNVAQMVVCIGQLAINNHRAIYHFQKTCKFFLKIVFYSSDLSGLLNSFQLEILNKKLTQKYMFVSTPD